MLLPVPYCRGGGPPRAPLRRPPASEKRILNIIYDYLNIEFAFKISYLYICVMTAFDLELYGKSNYDLAAELGARFRAYRIALRMTRTEMAEKAGVSAMTLARFENGSTSSISLSNFIGLLRAIKQLDRIVETIPEIPDSLYHKPRKSGVTQRVRRKKDEK